MLAKFIEVCSSEKDKKEYWMKLTPLARDQIREKTDDLASK